MRVLGLVLASLVAIAAPARAQQTGAITGVVHDVQGSVLPGAGIRVQPESGTPGVTQHVVAGTAGHYEIPSLPPGTYRVAVSHDGFTTAEHGGVAVRVAAVTRLDVVLTIAGVEQTVSVVMGTPVVDVTTTRAQTTIDHTFAAAVPTSRNPWVIAGLVPGVVTGRLDVGGSESVQQYAIEAFGSADSQKTFAVDGLKTNLPVSTGGLTFQYYDFAAYESFNFQVSGGTAENDVGGVFINMTTRSGTNRFASEASGYFANGAMQASNVDERMRERLRLAPGQVSAAAGHPLDLAFDLGGTAGGPLRRDRAWIFTAARQWRHDQFQTGAANPDGSPAIDDNALYNVLGKATVQATPAWKLAGSYTYNFKGRFHRRDPPYLIAEDRAAARQENRTHNMLVLAERSFARAFLEARAGRVGGEAPSRYQPEVQPDDIALRDVVRLTRVNASDTVFTLPIHRNQFDAAMSVFRQGGWGAHELKAGGRLVRERADIHFDRNGDMILELRDGVPFQAQIANTPVRAANRIHTWAAFVQDRWIAGRATVNAGVRFEGVNGWLPEQKSPAGTFAADRLFARRDDVAAWPLSVAPRLGVAFDPTGRGRTALKAYAGRFYNQIGSEVLVAVNPNALAVANLAWADLNGNLRAEREELGAFTGFAGGLTTRFDADARRPYNDEFNAGINHTLPFGTALSVTYHRRDHRNGLGIVDLARPAASYTPVPRTYVDPGTGQLATVEVYNLAPALQAVRDRLLTTIPDLRSTYHGVQLQASRWLTARAQLMAGVTVQRHRGFLHDGTFTNADFNNPNIRLNRAGAAIFTEVPWLVKASGTWLMPREWRLAFSYTGRAGDALPRLGVFAGLTQASETVHLARRGTDRTETVTQLLDVRGGRRLRVAGRQVELTLDVFNVFNANHVVLQNTVVGSTFGVPQLILGARQARIGGSVQW